MDFLSWIRPETPPIDDKLCPSREHQITFLDVLITAPEMEPIALKMSEFVSEFDQSKLPGGGVDRDADYVASRVVEEAEKLAREVVALKHKKLRKISSTLIAGCIHENLIRNLHHIVFAPAEDLPANLELVQKISVLQDADDTFWLSPIAQCPVMTDTARMKLDSMFASLDSHRSPLQHLDTFQQVYKYIGGMFSDIHVFMSADDLLSYLIYVIVKINPPLLFVRMKYCERYTPDIFMRGEKGYCLNVFQSALMYLQSVNVEDALLFKG